MQLAYMKFIGKKVNGGDSESMIVGPLLFGKGSACSLSVATYQLSFGGAIWAIFSYRHNLHQLNLCYSNTQIICFETVGTTVTNSSSFSAAVLSFSLIFSMIIQIFVKKLLSPLYNGKRIINGSILSEFLYEIPSINKKVKIIIIFF